MNRTTRAIALLRLMATLLCLLALTIASGGCGSGSRQEDEPAPDRGIMIGFYIGTSEETTLEIGNRYRIVRSRVPAYPSTTYLVYVYSVPGNADITRLIADLEDEPSIDWVSRQADTPED